MGWFIAFFLIALCITLYRRRSHDRLTGNDWTKSRQPRSTAEQNRAALCQPAPVEAVVQATCVTQMLPDFTTASIGYSVDYTYQFRNGLESGRTYLFDTHFFDEKNQPVDPRTFRFFVPQVEYLTVVATFENPTIKRTSRVPAFTNFRPEM